ncbi:hypothetical protein [Sphingobium bisphenolivorans]|uniref:hypothetical protein n=1 Tax=Sphingobium bisphenolivorans TaxID=1335760 RepID=UPI0003A348A5|nr:hypothetical protein [Sphingobium bisphenolivorans]
MMGRDLCWLIVPVLLVGGCAKSVDNGAAANNSAQAPVVETLEEPDSAGTESGQQAGLPTDEWAGRWNGPEGLFLDIQPSPNGKPGHYAITNRDTLDRQGDYAGVAEGATIRFVREGQQLTIRPGTGEETGFKYLAGKTDCLIVVAGQEGYCR